MRLYKAILLHKNIIIEKIAGKAIPLVLAVTFVLSGCETIPPDDAGIENIQFDEINTKWTKEEVNSKVKLAISKLTVQSRTIKEKYIDVESKLRSDLNSNGDNYYSLALIGFAKDVQNIQDQIADAVNGQRPRLQDSKKGPQYPYTFDEMMTDVSWYMNDLVSALCSLFIDKDTAALFNARVTAFVMAYYADQRKFYSSKVEETEVMSAFYEAVTLTEQLSGRQNLSGSNALSIAKILRQDILSSMPTGSGEAGTFLIQQFEDFAQFYGWVDDLSTLRYNLFLPSADY